MLAQILQQLPQQLLNGLVLGSPYALFALGFTLMFGVLGVINLTYGFYFTTGAFLALYGTYDTSRCLRLRWSFYHGGVLLLLYMDIMALAMIFFLLLYPYGGWIQ